jgi:hypothetical protein
MLQVLGRSDDSEWLVVQTIANEEAWIATSLVEDEVLSGQIPVVDVPATPTAVATTLAVQPTAPPPAALPQAAPPTGTNLLVNPGFESGETGWNRRGPTTFAVLTPADGHAQFVHLPAHDMHGRVWLSFTHLYLDTHTQTEIILATALRHLRVRLKFCS